MGGTTFETIGKGTDAKAVFASLRDQAQDEDGHGGYTGTIAEKPGFKVIRQTAMTRKEAQVVAEAEMDKNEKWGPAFAIPICAEGDVSKKVLGWMFFGWASC